MLDPPPNAGFLTRLIATLAAALAVGLVFVFAVRPWYLSWGTTAAERTMYLPGDSIVPDARTQETRAITIHAPVDKAWPWLAQLGQDRGGFYTYAVLDAIVPGRTLAFGTYYAGTRPAGPPDGSWTLALLPLNDSTTRFLARGRGAPGRSLLGVAFDRSIFEPIHFVMEKRMMIGIAQLAEGGTRHRAWNHAQVALWVVTFAMFAAGLVSVFVRHRWKRALGGTVAAAVVFQILTLGQPPFDVGIALVLLVAVLLWWPIARHSALSAIVER